MPWHGRCCSSVNTMRPSRNARPLSPSRRSRPSTIGLSLASITASAGIRTSSRCQPQRFASGTRTPISTCFGAPPTTSSTPFESMTRACPNCFPDTRAGSSGCPRFPRPCAPWACPCRSDDSAAGGSVLGPLGPRSGQAQRGYGCVPPRRLHAGTVPRPSRFLFILIPYVSAALMFLSVVVLVNHLLRGVREDDPARTVFRIAEQVSGVLVRAYVLYSLLLFANAALDRTVAEPREADVVEIAGDSLDLGRIPFRWIALRPVKDAGRVERVLLSRVDPPLWPGEPVLLDVRPGFFRLPWIARISLDDVRQI